MFLEESAPAKINLYLHVTGRRADGYHDLDSLSSFVSIADHLRLEPDAPFSFVVEGPQAPALAHEDPQNNLVVRAALALAALTGNSLRGSLTLIKNLPVASGIGGGSSDAAAVLRLLGRFWGLDPDDPRLAQAAAAQGQDVLLCLKISSVYLTATGTLPGPSLPSASVLLVNPRKPLATPSVYQECRRGTDPFSPLARLVAPPATLDILVEALKQRTNDLYAPACRLMSQIPELVAAIAATPHCLLSRMSGSGATCFGLYRNLQEAQEAATRLRSTHPDWWIEAGEMIGAESFRSF